MFAIRSVAASSYGSCVRLGRTPTALETTSAVRGVTGARDSVSVMAATDVGN